MEQILVQKTKRKISVPTLASLRHFYIFGQFAGIESNLLYCASSLANLFRGEYPELTEILDSYNDLDAMEKGIKTKIDYARAGKSQWIPVEEQSRMINEMISCQGKKASVITKISGLVTYIFEAENILDGKPIRAYELAQRPTILASWKDIKEQEEMGEGDSEDDVMEEDPYD